MNVDHDLYGEAIAQDAPDDRDEFFRVAASVMVQAIEDACDQRPRKPRGKAWRNDEERIEQIVEGLRRRRGDARQMTCSLPEKAIEAIAWLFDDSSAPLSAQGVATHVGADLQKIRYAVKYRPAEMLRTLSRERMGLRKTFPRRDEAA